MGKIATPEMRKYGYGKKLSAAVVAASGTLASLIPPSIVIVIYGIITEESIGALLLAGFIPGVVSAAIYAAMIVVWVKLFPQGGGYAAVSWRERLISSKGMWGAVLILAIIIGGIYTGIFTPTEAGGIGAFACFIIAVFRKGMSLADFKQSLLETGKTSIMLFAIIVGVMFFIRFLALSGAPAAFAEAIMRWPVHRVVVMMGILALFAVLGMFMNAASMMMLTVPVVLPAVVALGYDPIWFGIVVVKMCEVCLITAPVGLNLYVTHSVVPEVSFEELSLGVLPFLAMDFLTVAVFFVFP
jgi:tripartite ATP-independent transporter DctM subunit